MNPSAARGRRRAAQAMLVVSALVLAGAARGTAQAAANAAAPSSATTTAPPPLTAWSSATAPIAGLNPPANTHYPQVGMDFLSCPTKGFCVAVGGYEVTSHVSGALIETFAGGRWTASTAPLAGLAPQAAPNPYGVEWGGLSCPAVGECVAVGNYRDSAGNRHGVIETLSAGRWRAVTAPLGGLSPPAANGDWVFLGPVSCPRVGNCVAAGSYQDAAGDTRAFFETLSSGAWTAETAPVAGLDPPAPSDPGTTLNALSCPAPGSCVAVGYYSGGALIETLSGGRWAASTASTNGLVPAAPSTQGLDALDCPAPGSCVAVGNYYDGAGNEHGLIEMLVAGSWSAAAAPITGSSIGSHPWASLDAVSCAAAGSCVAVGDTVSQSAGLAEYDEGIVETLAAGRWTATRAPLAGLHPYWSPEDLLNALSCPTSRSCVAVGSYWDASGNIEPLIDTLTSGRWHAAQAPLRGLSPVPATDNPNPELDLLSCPAEGACTALGSYEVDPTPDTSASIGLIETLGPAEGYWLASAGGHVFAAGAAADAGVARGISTGPGNPVVGIAGTADGKGYLLVTANGTVAACGDASFHGDLPRRGIEVADVTAIAPTPDGGGYWLVGRDGGQFAFGDARYHGSLPAIGLHVHDVVGMVASPDGAGYLLVARDGGVFAFGDAKYRGSLPALGVRVDDIRAVLPSANGAGYVLVGSDGGAFVFGTGVPFFGSLPREGIRVGDVVGIALTPDDRGYFMAGADGAVYCFGDAKVQPPPVGLASSLPVAAIAGV